MGIFREEKWLIIFVQYIKRDCISEFFGSKLKSCMLYYLLVNTSRIALMAYLIVYLFTLPTATTRMVIKGRILNMNTKTKFLVEFWQGGQQIYCLYLVYWCVNDECWNFDILSWHQANEGRGGQQSLLLRLLSPTTGPQLWTG